MFSIPYIILFLFFLGISIIQLGFKLDKNSNRFLIITVIIGYIIFWGFRGYVATDWINYYPFFKNLSTDISKSINNNFFESGFVIYSTIIKKFTDSYEIYQLINTITDVVLLHFFFKRHLPERYYALGFAVFLAFNGCVFEINLLRNFKGLLLFLIALPYIEQRKPLHYFCFIIISLYFHWSSIVFIPLYFFLHKEVPLKIYMAIFILGNLIYLFKIEYIFPLIKSCSTLLPKEFYAKVIGYLNSVFYAKSYGLSIGFFERTLTTFLVIFYYNKLKVKKSNILILNSFLVYISLYLFCSEITIILQRVGGNFSYAYWILIPLIIQQVERNIRPIVFVFFSIFFIFKIYLMIDNAFYEYDSFLIGNSKSYKDRMEYFQKHRKEIDKKK